MNSKIDNSGNLFACRKEEIDVLKVVFCSDYNVMFFVY